MTHPVPAVRRRYRQKTGRKAEHGVRGFEERLRRGGKVDRRSLAAREVEQIEDWLIEDRGGADRLNHAERLMLQVTAFAFWVCLRGRQDGIRKGILDEQGELPPVLRKSFISYANVAKRNLELLGIRPDKADRTPTLEQYLAARQSAPSAQTAPKREPSAMGMTARRRLPHPQPQHNPPETATATD